MKRIIILIAFVLLTAILYIGLRRKFFCIGENCVTVWKTYDNKSYVVFEKYYGIFEPNDNFIKTTNTNDISIYIDTTCSNNIYVALFMKDYLLINNDTTAKKIIDLTDIEEEFRAKLCNTANDKNLVELKENVIAIYINIEEFYARNKHWEVF